MKTFAQGIHLEYHKEKTEDKSISEAEPPKKVIIPLHQHTGAVCDSLVKIGDEVYEGQKIGDSSKFISAPIHASISGKVTQIEESIVIENPKFILRSSTATENGSEILNPKQIPNSKIQIPNPDEIRKIVREAGIVGLGGAAFPAHVKLTPPKDKKIDTVIINGCECEPYITADHRLMLERSEEIIFGARAIARAVGAERIIIGIEENKRNAIEVMQKALTHFKPNNSLIANIPLPEGEGKRVRVVSLETKYPQGGEKQLIKAVLNREVPSGGLPSDIGAVVSNVGTCVAIAEAIKFNKPLIKRVITVTGSAVKEPKNILVRIGTSLQEVINQCGGLTEDACKIIIGGPMMGTANFSLENPIVKGTCSIVVFTKKEAKEEKVYPCVKCARCVNHCPMYLLPTRLAAFAEHEKYSEFEERGGQDCIECGCCAYVCPAKIPLVHWIKLAKLKLVQMK